MTFRSTAALAMAFLAVASIPATADDPTFKIELKDGVITPLELEVPANTRIRLEVSNTGTTPAEFESVELKKEKVIAPGNSSVVVIRNLDPGSYAFFDEFHMDKPHGKITAK
ncbi:cupredoxin domain-containing protein [Aestuariivirga sp.]|uniref:cupredoxin domain-containing protein n=1 Tax=Aestuariivirga sp. TaxID=2650926 RepID=UPI0035AE3E4D